MAFWGWALGVSRRNPLAWGDSSPLTSDNLAPPLRKNGFDVKCPQNSFFFFWLGLTQGTQCQHFGCISWVLLSPTQKFLLAQNFVFQSGTVGKKEWWKINGNIFLAYERGTIWDVSTTKLHNKTPESNRPTTYLSSCNARNNWPEICLKLSRKPSFK